MSSYIIVYIWLIFSLMLIIEFIPLCAELNKLQKLAVILICLIAGPAFAIVSVCEALLDMIFPEGWDDGG